MILVHPQSNTNDIIRPCVTFFMIARVGLLLLTFLNVSIWQ